MRFSCNLLAALAASAFLALGGTAAAAPEDGLDDAQVDLTIGLLMSLAVVGDPNLNFEARERELLAGTTPAQPVNFLVSMNQPWILQIRGGRSHWASDTDYDKPVSDIEWRAGGSGTFTDLSTAPATAAAGRQGGRNIPVQIQIRVSLDMAEDLPGSYTYSSVLYELVAP